MDYRCRYQYRTSVTAAIKYPSGRAGRPWPILLNYLGPCQPSGRTALPNWCRAARRSSGEPCDRRAPTHDLKGRGRLCLAMSWVVANAANAAKLNDQWVSVATRKARCLFIGKPLVVPG